ncbi:MAG: WecB/TagA/CpsF family glycosyltransferase [Thermodesulfovibrionales bacterium]|nr:WecB/TagA/CpsF family glycosyltransferase [Thermodesulfovibrionales bacterium]
MKDISSIKVLGSRVHMADIPFIIAQMDEWIKEYDETKKCRQIVVTGFHGIWEARKNKEFRSILNSADLWAPDGIAPIWVARLKGLKGVGRTPGAELMTAFFELSNKRGYSSFFYGDTDETLNALCKTLKIKYPEHKIVGKFSPPFRKITAQEDEEHIKMINEAKPDVLWVGLGLPKQDRWVFEHKDRLNVPVAIGVGAAFGFLSGNIKRAPDWAGRYGLEWLWRFAKEPKKLWRRDLIDGPRFIFHVFLELTGLRKYD